MEYSIKSRCPEKLPASIGVNALLYVKFYIFTMGNRVMQTEFCFQKQMQKELID